MEEEPEVSCEFGGIELAALAAIEAEVDAGKLELEDDCKAPFVFRFSFINSFSLFRSRLEEKGLAALLGLGSATEGGAAELELKEDDELAALLELESSTEDGAAEIELEENDELEEDELAALLEFGDVGGFGESGFCAGGFEEENRGVIILIHAVPRTVPDNANFAKFIEFKAGFPSLKQF